MGAKNDLDYLQNAPRQRRRDAKSFGGQSALRHLRKKTRPREKAPKLRTRGRATRREKGRV